MLANHLHASVEHDFTAVNQLILKRLTSDVPLVTQIGEYIIQSGGKRLRPLLVLLAANAIGCKDERHLTLAAVIEFLHTATLLHDDVVDASDLRRGKKTANANWGNAASVLVGDFLYSRSFQMMVEMNSMPVMDILSTATGVIAEGEVLQLSNIGNANITEAQYMEVIRSKTAVLFEAASHSGAVITDGTPQQVAALKTYGLELGIAFQLVDDILDYSGNAEDMGKNVGDDLAEGKPTLPLIYAMKHSSEENSELIRKAIKKGGLENLDKILNIVNQSGALDYTKKVAIQHQQKALKCLDAIGESVYKDSLIQLCHVAVQRCY